MLQWRAGGVFSDVPSVVFSTLFVPFFFLMLQLFVSSCLLSQLF